ncbi:MAG: helix-turn-helix transcriptional regulator [Fusobacteriaceae bacterium]|nr:helix-turn-helix transcriptional regulator [Fusobacteriaceae bacterium]
MSNENFLNKLTLSELRLLKEDSQNVLSEKLKISVPGLRTKEQGKSPVMFLEGIKLAEIYSLSLNDVTQIIINTDKTNSEKLNINLNYEISSRGFEKNLTLEGLRKIKKINQKDLSKKLKVSVAGLRFKEFGKSPVSFLEGIKLAEIYNLSLNDITQIIINTDKTNSEKLNINLESIK